MRVLTVAQAQWFYNRLGRLQDTQAFYERAALTTLLEASSCEHARAVLEFGCGTGRFAQAVLERLTPSARYVGVDSSSTMVRLARGRLGRFGARAQVIQTDGATRLAFEDGQFDRFVSTYVLDLLDPDAARELLAEAHRVLEPAGKLCLASLTSGASGLARPLTRAWAWLATRQPLLTGGCRPVELLELLPKAGWRVERREVITRFGIPTEVVVAAAQPSPSGP
jgi:ubiquinone/menaquinone biosynthesis C-methylase UbiE